MDQIVHLRVDRHVSDVVFVGEHDPRFDFVAPFASVLVQFAVVILIITFAVKASRRVRAVLGTDLWRFDALIDV